MHGIINIDKPKGMSSQHAVTRVKRLLGMKKAGHAGTLDPLATGVLLICLGEATKVARFLMDLDKEYVALMKLGERTDTLDAEGILLEKKDCSFLQQETIEQALDKFAGMIRQTPPMYSAVKVGGRPLYKLARKGIEVARPDRVVLIRSIEMLRFDLPLLEIRVSCSKGTYIRTLCDDIGKALGVGAHIAELRRTRIGKFFVEESLSFEELEKAVGSSGIMPCATPAIQEIDAVLNHLPEVTLTDVEFSRARNGSPTRYSTDNLPQGGFLRLKDPMGDLFAVGKAINGEIKIERILHIRE